ncbi:MAG TPA: helix-turn-helix domain-containing protein [Solirubrobacteraceae bacterium]|nr:helix-turn-helix domain-containing protein [Solirubrobacteraceae bacterium]
MAYYGPADTPLVTDHDAFGRIVKRLDFEEITHRMLASFRSSINGYRRLPQELLEGNIGEIIEHNLEVFRSSTLAGREPASVELEPFRVSARTRAAEGMPLEDLLHAYRLGGRLAWQAVVETARPEEQGGLLAGAEVLMRYIDLVSATVAQAYLDARQLAVSEEERRLRTLLAALCEDDGAQAAETAALAALAGLPLASEYRPFALSVGEDGAIRHGQLAAELRARGILALTDGDRVSGLLAAEQELHPPAGALCAVEPAAPRGALAAALERVRLVIDLGRRLGRSGELGAGEVALELLLAGGPDAAEHLEARVFGPLEGEAGRRAVLPETLAAFLSCDADRRSAAAELHIHPNTLDYRLRRIEELTGLRLATPRDLATLVLAHSSRELRRPSGVHAAEA